MKMSQVSSLWQLLEDTVARHGQRSALVYGDIHWSWSDLHARCERLLGGFQAQGILAGDHVALWLSNSPCFVLSFLALQGAGARVVPLNPDMKAGDFGPRGSRLTAVVTESSFAHWWRRRWLKIQL